MKKCLKCGDSLSGRTDKKYCCDGCRSAFNNNRKKQSEKQLRTVNSRLRRNYRILSELNPGQSVTASKNKLLAKGFDFEFFTQIRKSPQGITCFYLYDQGYFPLSNGSYVLIKQDRMRE